MTNTQNAELPEEHYVKKISSAGGTTSECNCGAIFVFSSEIQGHINWHLQLSEHTRKAVEEATKKKDPKDCYCVCHSPYSSCGSCEHCNGEYLRGLQDGEKDLARAKLDAKIEELEMHSYDDTENWYAEHGALCMIQDRIADLKKQREQLG